MRMSDQHITLSQLEAPSLSEDRAYRQKSATMTGIITIAQSVDSNPKTKKVLGGVQ